MGYGHILLVRNDAIKVCVPASTTADELAAEVGRAVVGLCLHPARIPDDNGKMVRARFAAVFNDASGVEWAGERHTTDEDLFLWSDNALRALRELDIDALDRIRNKVAQLIAEKRAAG